MRKKKHEVPIEHERFLILHHFEAQVGIGGHRDTMVRIQATLMDELNNFFKTICFGKFIDLKSFDSESINTFRLI